MIFYHPVFHISNYMLILKIYYFCAQRSISANTWDN